MLASATYTDRALEYANQTVAGGIPACKWAKLACQRQIDDLAREKSDKNWPFWFDSDAANTVCDFIEHFSHVHGVWARKQMRLRLEPFQIFIVSTVFGWKKREQKTRRFRVAYIEIPRKNAKSTLTSAVGLYLLAADREPGAHVVSAAVTRTQAKIVFADAQLMAKREPAFLRQYGVQVRAHAITQPATGSKFEAISAEYQNLDGLNVHAALIDELHAHDTRGVWDILDTATGSRAQPLIWAITTAGVNRASVCWEQRGYVTEILQRMREDDNWFGIIYTIDDGDDYFVEESWKKANPNYGVSIYPDSLKSEARLAQQLPSAQTAFLTKHLNVWINAEHSWIDVRRWEACADKALEIEDFAGEAAFVGIDLAQRSDIAAVVILFPPSAARSDWVVFGRYYLPEAVVERSENTHYQGWRRMGRLTVTDGDVIDDDFILEDIVEWLEAYDVREIGHDPWRSQSLKNSLIARGVPEEKIIAVRQQTKVLSPNMIDLEAMILKRQIRHDGDPIMTWMMSNVVTKRDANDNLHPRKASDDKKIDGVLALLIALDRAHQDIEGTPDFSEGLYVI
jgi:phage terminase large subunit-like protein